MLDLPDLDKIDMLIRDIRTNAKRGRFQLDMLLDVIELICEQVRYIREEEAEEVELSS